MVMMIKEGNRGGDAKCEEQDYEKSNLKRRREIGVLLYVFLSEHVC